MRDQADSRTFPLPLEPAERDAQAAPVAARVVLNKAIAAYIDAGYGSHVTAPLCEALLSVEYSIREVMGSSQSEHAKLIAAFSLPLEEASRGTVA